MVNACAHACVVRRNQGVLLYAPHITRTTSAPKVNWSGMQARTKQNYTRQAGDGGEKNVM